MSDNKMRYYTVTTEKVVKARNQRDAFLAASRSAKVPKTEVLSTEQWIERIPASTAHGVSASV